MMALDSPSEQPHTDGRGVVLLPDGMKLHKVGSSTAVWSRRLGPGDGSRAWGRVYMQTKHLARLARHFDRFHGGATVYRHVMVDHNLDRDDPGYIQSSEFQVPWAGTKPYFVMAGNFTDGTFKLTDATKNLAEVHRDDFADMVAEDLVEEDLPEGTPVVLMIPRGGDGGLDLPRRIAARTERVVYALTGEYSPTSHPDGSWSFGLRSKDRLPSGDEGPRGAIVRMNPPSQGGVDPSLGERWGSITTLDGQVIPDRDVMTRPMPNLKGIPKGRASASDKDWANWEGEHVRIDEVTQFEHRVTEHEATGWTKDVPYNPQRAYFVATHGDLDGFQLVVAGESEPVEVSGSELGRFLNRRPSIQALKQAAAKPDPDGDFAGKPPSVVLLSCLSAVHGQQVADEVQLTVHAPTKEAGVNPGNPFDAHDQSTLPTLWLEAPADDHEVEFLTFHPTQTPKTPSPQHPNDNSPAPSPSHNDQAMMALDSPSEEPHTDGRGVVLLPDGMKLHKVPGSSTAVWSRRLGPGDGSRAWGRAYLETEYFDQLAGSLDRFHGGATVYQHVMVNPNLDRDDPDYIQSFEFQVPWAGTKPYFVMAANFTDSTFKLTDATKNLAKVHRDDFADMVAEDLVQEDLPADVPVVLMIPRGGDGGLHLPRRIAARTERVVYALTGEYHPTSHPDGSWSFGLRGIYRLPSGDEGPRGAIVRVDPPSQGGVDPSLGERWGSITTLDGWRIPDQDVMTRPILNLKGIPKGWSSGSDKDWGQDFEGHLTGVDTVRSIRHIYRSGLLDSRTDEVPWDPNHAYFVTLHGDPLGFSLRAAGESELVRVDGRELGQFLNRRPSIQALKQAAAKADPAGKHPSIVLLSCRSAVHGQQVANAVGLQVHAPNVPVTVIRGERPIRYDQSKIPNICLEYDGVFGQFHTHHPLDGLINWDLADQAMMALDSPSAQPHTENRDLVFLADVAATLPTVHRLDDSTPWHSATHDDQAMMALDSPSEEPHTDGRGVVLLPDVAATLPTIHWLDSSSPWLSPSHDDQTVTTLNSLPDQPDTDNHGVVLLPDMAATLPQSGPAQVGGEAAFPSGMTRVDSVTEPSLHKDAEPAQAPSGVQSAYDDHAVRTLDSPPDQPDTDGRGVVLPLGPIDGAVQFGNNIPMLVDPDPQIVMVRTLGEIGTYLDARFPSPSERVWQGADGRERFGNAEEWHEWIENGERLRLALANARKRVGKDAQRILAQARYRGGRLDDELRRLKAELQLGETGELESSGLSEPQLPPRPRSAGVAEQVRWVREVVETLQEHLDTMDVPLDSTGDAMGDVGGDTGPSAAWLEGLRLFGGITTSMRNLEELVAPRTDVLAGVDQGKVDADADQVEADAKLLVQKLVDVSRFLQWSAFRRPAPPWIYHLEEGSFNREAVVADQQRAVSAVMPPNALEAAVQDVDMSELRVLASSVASQGLFYRIDRRLLYRSDTRVPEIVFTTGFEPWEKICLSDLMGYVGGITTSTNLVSTSRSLSFAADYTTGDHYVYEIDVAGGIDLVATMGRHAWVEEQEVVFPGGLMPWSIVGAWQPDGTFIKNENYRAPTVDSEMPLVSVEVLGKSSVRGAGGGAVQGPVVGIEGVPYPGPSRHLLSGSVSQQGRLPEVVHRGVFEVESVDGVPYVRLYTVLTMAQVPRVDKDSGRFTANLGDVQQEPESGRITVVRDELDRPLAVYFGSLAALKVISATAKDLRKRRPWQLDAQAPVIRSFLVPLDLVRTLSGGAAAREAYPGQEAGKVVNIRPGLEPNLFTVPQSLLPELEQHAVPYSLITYTEQPAESLFMGDHAGEVQHPDVLRERLGVPVSQVPALEPALDPWPTLVELEGGGLERVHTVASLLRQHYATYQQSKQPASERVPHALLVGDESLSYYARKQALDAFVAEHKDAVAALADKESPDPARAQQQAVDRFVTEVVEPWATQAAIAETIAKDHERMREDLNVTGAITPNDFAALKKSQTQRRQYQEGVGKELSGLWRQGASPREVVDHLIGRFPELARKFDEITVWHEQYRYYEHAQMVLGQYQKLTKREQEIRRLVPVDAMVKAILFHDIESDNAKRQFAAEQAAGKFGHDAAPEHRLAVETVKRYADLFTNKKAVEAALALVDSDPFGYYLQKKISADDAFWFVATWALKLGDHKVAHDQFLTHDAVADIQRLFGEFHQYYQADFSSYTIHSSYLKKDSPDKTWRGQPAFEAYFAHDASGGLQQTADSRHYEYSDLHGYRERFAKLAQYFETPEQVREAYQRIEQERAKQKAWFADWALTDDDPLERIRPDYQPTRFEHQHVKKMLSQLRNRPEYAEQWWALPTDLHAVAAFASGYFDNHEAQLHAGNIDAAVLTVVVAAGLRRLPTHPADSYVALTPEDAAQYKPGMTTTALGPRITSPLRASTGAEVVFQSWSGHSTASLLPNHPTPAVMFPPKTRFRVDAIEPAHDLGPDGIRIYLKEIHDDPNPPQPPTNPPAPHNADDTNPGPSTRHNNTADPA
ncbi:scabin-related ADP-ribosyltransferase, partial [Streptomyces sp. NPDC005122]